MVKSFCRMNINNPLVKELKAASWWEHIRSLNSEPDINIQVRPSHINVYYKMNNLLRISLGRKDQIQCFLHYKFIPLIGKKIKRNNSYIALIPKDDQLDVPESSDKFKYDLITKGILNKDNLKILKEQILAYVNEEKDYQSRLIFENQNTIIDVEVAFNETDEEAIAQEGKQINSERTRIDLLNYDKNIKKIIAVELKTIFDNRLYNGEIGVQLAKYSSFLAKKEKDIRQAYADVIQVKIALGLLEVDSELAKVNFSDVEIEKKPLLVVICYSQVLIDTFKDKILEAVKNSSRGVFFFGKTGDLNIPKRRSKNKIIFNQ